MAPTLLSVDFNQFLKQYKGYSELTCLFQALNFTTAKYKDKANSKYKMGYNTKIFEYVL